MKISLLADYPTAAPTIAKWYFEEWGHNDLKASVESITEKLLLNANRYEIPIVFVAHMKEGLLGAGEIKFRELPEYPDFNYWLDGIYVPLQHRGKGISTKLIDYAKLKAIEFKLPGLHLRCEAHNVKLYEARGFRVLVTENEKSIMELLLNT